MPITDLRSAISALLVALRETGDDCRKRGAKDRRAAAAGGNAAVRADTAGRARDRSPDKRLISAACERCARADAREREREQVLRYRFRIVEAEAGKSLPQETAIADQQQNAWLMTLTQARATAG